MVYRITYIVRYAKKWKNLQSMKFYIRDGHLNAYFGTAMTHL